jgi:hypothetical protein
MQHQIRDPQNIKNGNPRGRLEDQVAISEGKPGGLLNPTFLEWLMGFPIRWTESAPSGMPSSPRSRSGSGNASSSTKQES